MDSLDLHSLILEELSEVLAITCRPQTRDVFSSDPVVQKVLAQCPPLPADQPPHAAASAGGSRPVVHKRHEDAMLALAKLLSKTDSPVVRTSLLSHVLAYLKALPAYAYSFSSFGTNGVPNEHWFLEGFITRLLTCAVQSPDLAGIVLEHIWEHLDKLVDILESDDSERIVTFALPALLGSMEALEKSSFRYRSSDVLMADTLSVRLLSAKVIENIRASVSGPSSASPLPAPVRRTISLYLQSSIGLSGSYVLAQFLLVLRAILESRLAMQLVESGELDGQLIDKKSPHQLWDLISQLDIHRHTSRDDGLGVQTTGDPELQQAFTRILSLSLQTYSDTRALLLANPLVTSGTDDGAQPSGTGTVAKSMLATSMSIEYRSLYSATLVCLLLGRLDQNLLDSILDHISSDYSHRLASLTVVCFRVLVTIAAFFPSSRDAITTSATNFITNPSSRLVDQLEATGSGSKDEQKIILPAAAAIAACMNISAGKPRIVSTIHTLFNALTVNRAASNSDASLRIVRISRSVILVLSQLAMIYKDPEITSLVVSMVCAPRFTNASQLISLVIQCSADLATIAEGPVFVDIVATVLKRITFGAESDDLVNLNASHTLTTLAWKVASRAEIIEGFFCEVLRSFIDVSIDIAAPPKFKKRAVTPLSIYLPIIDALVAAKGYSIDKAATADQISLWRNFWFHMVIRGYITEKSYIAAYGKTYANLAAKSPILVHPSSVNYLETEIEYNSILQREFTDARLAQLRQSLTPIISVQNAALLRNISFAQAVFLLSVYNVEIARAQSGNCATVLRYFSNYAVTSSTLLPEFESIADLAIAAYVRETTSKRWSIEASLASDRPVGDLSVAEAVQSGGLGGGAKSGETAHGTSSLIKAQVRELMVASCHHLEQVSRWAQRYVDKILRAFPQALLDKSVICTLLELVQLVWKSCKAEQDDQFVPVYWFTSQSLGITLQLPDSIKYRKTLFSSFSSCAKRWLELVGKASPMELETLLQVYLSMPCDDDLNYEPHIGHALALEVGNGIKYGTASSVDTSSSVAALASNSSPFAYRLGLRDYLRGYIGRGGDVETLKKSLSDIYTAGKESPGMPLPETGPSIREAIDMMHHATYHIIAADKADRELVRLLVWVPLVLFDEGVMRAASHMWTAVIVERADAEALIMVELTVAWTWLIQQRLGLFSQKFEPKNPFAAKMSYTPSDKSARSRGYAVISRALAPHTLLIEAISQRFDSVKHLPYSNFNVINAILRILQVTFENLDRITTNALARGPLFMLVHLGFKLLKLGFESSPILETKLRDGLYKLAFRWFALAPRWSFSGSKATLAKEIRILIDTRHTIKGDTPVLRSKPSQVARWAASGISTGAGSSSRGASAGGVSSSSGALPLTPIAPANPGTQPHGHLHLRGLGFMHIHRRHHGKSSSVSGQLGTAAYSSSASAVSLNEEDAADRDLILNTPREQLKQRALRNQSLLLLLIENEICRMATWANPTDQKISYFPDVGRFARNAEMTDAGWQNLVLDAWVADPRLAVQLIHRFSNPVVKRELKSLICKFPGELVREPDALPLLIEQLRADAGGSSSLAGAQGLAKTHSRSATNSSFDFGGSIAASGLFSNLDAPLTFREQKFLLYWSAVPPITSTSYLASSYSKNPLALQYAMRSLECFPVDITFFYIPQLVQALRHDSSGYVERAIISSAQISQLFAHQIIWNMKANMYKDEDSQVPDSLKPALDNIVEKIVDGLSGADREYYEKEFDFFGEVTGISGKLKPFIKKSKIEKKRKIDEEMRKIKVEPGVYLPSNPDGTVIDIDYNSGRPLQSHAKAPFMATFVISKPQSSGDEVQELLKETGKTATPSDASDDSSTAESSIRVAADSRLPAIEETGPLDDEAQDGQPNSQPIHEQQELDITALASKLSISKTRVHRSGTAISDAPDLIGISSHVSGVAGRASRDSARSRSGTNTNSGMTAAAAAASLRKRGNSISMIPASAGSGNPASGRKASKQSHEVISRLSAIFKVGDDCRQDVLALQLIAVFKNIFTSCGLDLYLYPYRVVATAPGWGVVDVIPNSISRDQMGREKVNSLSDYFATKYHGVDSIKYQQARSNFVQSLAAYSVLSYLLQFKDRHNGNIMLDDEGHIIHIDFGFILDIAPGGITFESAPFKLTTEYIQVMGGSREAQPYKLFCELCIKAYLASRPYADKIIQIVALMLESGLPCFKGETTLAKLRSRFQLDKSERDAAQFMADRIEDSFESKWTVMYDQFQKATNGIPY